MGTFMWKKNLDHVLIWAAAQGFQQVMYVCYIQISPDKLKTKIIAKFHLPKTTPKRSFKRF